MIPWKSRREPGAPERLNAAAVYVDVISVGAGVVDKLKLGGVEVVAVNAAEVATSRSANKDDAQGKIIAATLDRDGALAGRGQPAFLVDKDMAEDLAGELASVKYGIDGKGYLTVEMKDQIASASAGRLTWPTPWR